jgi:hypothetical protein
MMNTMFLAGWLWCRGGKSSKTVLLTLKLLKIRSISERLVPLGFRKVVN